MSKHCQEVVFLTVGFGQVIQSLPELLLELLALSDVAHDPSEIPTCSDAEFADGKFHRKSRAIFSAADDFPADADDPRGSGSQIILKILIMFGIVGIGHQYLYILTNRLFGL